LLDMLTMERNRLGMCHDGRVKADVEAHILWLEECLKNSDNRRCGGWRSLQMSENGYLGRGSFVSASVVRESRCLLRRGCGDWATSLLLLGYPPVQEGSFLCKPRGIGFSTSRSLDGPLQCCCLHGWRKEDIHSTHHETH